MIDRAETGKAEEYMLETFQLEKRYDYIIYGASYAGKVIYETMHRAGYRIRCFLDRRAEEIGTQCGLPVYTPDRYPHRDFEDTVIVIAVRVPFEHEAIASFLYQLGYDKIIYRPCSGSLPAQSELMSAEDNYERLLSGRGVSEALTFVKYLGQFHEKRLFDDSIIHEDDRSVTVYLPTDLCFTNTKECVRSLGLWEPVKDSILLESLDLPVYMGYYSTVYFFRACMGTTPNVRAAIKAYEDWIADTPISMWNVSTAHERVVERMQVYNGLESVCKMGDGFFRAHPVQVEWNPKGYFNIVDGHHRTCFYVAKGIPLIPAVMSKEDHEKWIHWDALKKCLDFISGKNMLAAYAPIPHPNFYQFPTYRDVGGHTRIQMIAEFLALNRISFQGRTVLDAGAYYCYLSQFFARLGAKVTAVEYDRESHEFAKLLNELLYCGDIDCICGGLEDLDTSRRFSVTIMLTVLYPYVGTALGRKILGNIDAVTEDLLLWESGDQPEEEIQYILKHSTFEHYLKISETVGTSKIRELGVFYRDHVHLEKPYWQ